MKKTRNLKLTRLYKVQSALKKPKKIFLLYFTRIFYEKFFFTFIVSLSVTAFLALRRLSSSRAA